MPITEAAIEPTTPSRLEKNAMRSSFALKLPRPACARRGGRISAPAALKLKVQMASTDDNVKISLLLFDDLQRVISRSSAAAERL